MIPPAGPLRRYFALRVAIAAVLVVLIFVILGFAIAGSRESERFRAGASRTVGTVVALRTFSDGYDDDFVDFEYPTAAGTKRGTVVAYDIRRYKIGREVVVLFQLSADGGARAELEDEPYDLASPILGASALGALGASLMYLGIRWPRRSMRLVASDEGSFQMLAAPVRPRFFHAARTRLGLYPLDAKSGDLPVVSVPMIGDQAMPVRRTTVLVKGSPRPGGAVVIRMGEQTLWPAGRCRRASSRGVEDLSINFAFTTSAEPDAALPLVIDREFGPRQQVLSIVKIAAALSALWTPLVLWLGPDLLPFAIITFAATVSARRQLWKMKTSIDDQGIFFDGVAKRFTPWSDISAIQLRRSWRGDSWAVYLVLKDEESEIWAAEALAEDDEDEQDGMLVPVVATVSRSRERATALFEEFRRRAEPAGVRILEEWPSGRPDEAG